MGEQVPGFRGSPTPLLCIDGPAWDNHMHVRVIIQSAGLRVQNRTLANLTVQVFIVPGKVAAGAHRSLEQQRIHFSLVLPGDSTALGWQGERHHEIVHRQQFGLLAFQPERVVRVLTTLATAVPTRAKRAPCVLTARTLPLQLPVVLGTAATHGRQRVPMRIAKTVPIVVDKVTSVALNRFQKCHDRSLGGIECDGQLLDHRVDQLRGVLLGRLGQFGVDQSCIDRTLSQLLLDVLQAQAPLQKVCCIRVAQRVGCYARTDARIACNALDSPLHTALVHCLDGAITLLGVEPGRKQQAWMAMCGPVSAKADERALRQDHVSILLALAQAYVNPHLGGIDVLYLQRQGLHQTQSHTVGAQEVGLVALFPGGVDQSSHLIISDHIRQGLDLLGFDDIAPVPLLL